jgi:hypothetical protein
MGCRLVRGETIYFVKHSGSAAGETDRHWYSDPVDGVLLPGVYACRDEQSPAKLPSVVPIEIRIFEA